MLPGASSPTVVPGRLNAPPTVLPPALRPTPSLTDEREAARLAAVRRYRVLDTPEDGTFDRITALAARLFRVPIAIVSIVDEDRIWFASRHGLGATEIPREPGLCASAILHHEPYLLSDALDDPVALTNPLVAGEFGLRFYAAAPLTTRDGHNLGTMCIIDTEPRILDAAEVETLRDLAALVMSELELRLEARRAVRSEVTLSATSVAQKHEAEALARALQASLLPPQLPQVPGIELAACYRPAEPTLVGGDFYDVFPLARASWGIALGDVCGKGPRAAGITAAVRYAVRAAALEHRSPADVLRVLNEAMLIDEDPDDPRFCTLVYARLRPHGTGFRFTMASGGHPFPLVLRRSGTIQQVGRIGSLVGCFPDAAFADVSVPLGPGDSVICYTDGLSEAPVGRDMLGSAGIGEHLADCQGRSAAEIAGRLEAAALGGGGTQRDDLAILVVKVAEAPLTGETQH